MASISRKDIERLVAPFRVTKGRGFHLKDYKPGATLGLRNKEQAGEWLSRGVDALADLQERLYAQDRWALLLVFQAMDAAGKDSTIKHVMSGVNPQGCQVYSFKAPSTEELDHDFLWRTARLPARARPHRHLQSFVLRRDAGRPRAPGAAGEAAAARRS